MRAILSKHLVLLFVLAGVLLAVGSGVCYRAIRILAANQTRVTHTHEVLNRLETTRASLALAESSQRNLLVTGQTGHLETYARAVTETLASADTLDDLTADNPNQQARAKRLREAVGERLAQLEDVLAAYRARGLEYVRTSDVLEHGRLAMNRSLGLIREMEDEENVLLAERSAQSASSLRWLTGAFSLVALLGLGLLGVIFLTVRQEVATRAAAERRIRDSEQRLLMAVEAAELGIWEHDLVANRITGSDRCLAMFGGAPDGRMTPVLMDARLHPAERGRLRALIEMATDPAGRGEFVTEYRVVWPDGTVRWLRARARALFDVGPRGGHDRRAVRLVGTLLDITEAKRAEEELRAAKDRAEAASHAKDHFLAVLSHELRTPLTPVLAAVSELEQRPDVPETVRADLGVVRRNVEMEARLIDDLLDLTRVGHGKIQLHPETVDVHALLRRVVAACDAEAVAKGVRLSVDLSAASRHVWADPARLQQVVWNLVGNAVKFTPKGGEVTVRTRTADPRTAEDAERSGAGDAPPQSPLNGERPNPEPSIVIEVRDTGIGIEPDVLPRLFDAFEQGERTINRRFGGLGLGLSIAKAIADLHGADLSAESAGTGQGSTFRLRLRTIDVSDGVGAPAATPAPALPGGTSTPAHAEPARAPRLRVLLVEDNEDTRRLMGRLLRSFGHQVEAADTVASALDAARRERFDLLLSDIGLPDGTGWDLIRQLDDRRPPRAIALSGFGMTEDVHRSLEAGFAEHLTKPVNVNDLRATIERVAVG